MFVTKSATRDYKALFNTMQQKNIKPEWLKNRGYLHVSDHKNLDDRTNLLAKIKDPKYISRHAFFPLIHSNIRERRYKKVHIDSNKRFHSFKEEDGTTKKNFKVRPIHYATHVDAMIFGYYAEQLSNAYEHKLLQFPEVSNSIIAYRKIQTENSSKNKSTIHFAHEVFNELKLRAVNSSCCVLKFDIKSFFSSIDHSLLKYSWSKVIGEASLPTDHYNVFKASTRFSYILLDDFRLPNKSWGRRGGFDEKRLADYTKNGIQSFFESPKELREKIKRKEIKIHRFPFRNKGGSPIGIPQGLPISAVLANIYLLEFDIAVVETVINKYRAYYRRYSDDIIVICNPSEANEILNVVNQLIQKSKVEISLEKTEKFTFTMMDGKFNQPRVTSIKNDHNLNKVGVPFTYLGFEFYGYKTLIKSHNLAKFYRRMISSVKSKCRQALHEVERGVVVKPIIFRRQLYKLYTSYPLTATKIYRNKKWLEKNERGEYCRKTKLIENKKRSNYFSYVNRASLIMNEPAIKNQLRNHIKIFNQAVQKHITKKNKINNFF